MTGDDQITTKIPWSQLFDTDRPERIRHPVQQHPDTTGCLRPTICALTGHRHLNNGNGQCPIRVTERRTEEDPSNDDPSMLMTDQDDEGGRRQTDHQQFGQSNGAGQFGEYGKP